MLLTTIHVITDWPISDHMIGTSQRSRTAIGVPRAPRECAKAGKREDIYKRPPAPALLPSGRLYTWA
ncbi:unnamed protein product [Staurois parvus]|uniref:Uncharacterized protein n=1 Tax=Staurois parvus TaxID=386267 RepID=A0ABN9CQ81_9NEOB|nr:unnamed protein product [Staurois parvus]